MDLPYPLNGCNCQPTSVAGWPVASFAGLALPSTFPLSSLPFPQPLPPTPLPPCMCIVACSLPFPVTLPAYSLPRQAHPPACVSGMHAVTRMHSHAHTSAGRSLGRVTHSSVRSFIQASTYICACLLSSPPLASPASRACLLRAYQSPTYLKHLHALRAPSSLSGWATPVYTALTQSLRLTGFASSTHATWASAWAVGMDRGLEHVPVDECAANHGPNHRQF